MEFTFLWVQAISKEMSSIFMMCFEENKTSNVAESHWMTDLVRDGFSEEVMLVFRFG